MESKATEDRAMKNMSLTLVTLLSVMLVVPSSLAGTSEVTWTNADKYRDVDPGEGHKKKFKAKVFSEFEQHFAKLAASLPDGQTLKVDVTDVDLAGDVRHNMQRIRVVKDLYFPRIKFSYQVVDSSGKEISSGQENLKDMNFMMGSSLKYKNDLIGYEKKMLDEWFFDTFKS